MDFTESINIWNPCSLLLSAESASRSVGSDSSWPCELYSPWNAPGQNNGVGSLSLLQGIFPTQGLNPVFPRCRQILYQLSHKERPRILEAYPFSRGSSRPRNWTGSPALQEDSLPTELSGKVAGTREGTREGFCQSPHKKCPSLILKNNVAPHICQEKKKKIVRL